MDVFWLGCAVVLGIVITPRAIARLRLSLAKHRSLQGHVRWSKRIAGMLPFYEFDESSFCGVDGAPQDVVTARRSAFAAMASRFRAKYTKTAAASAELQDGLADLQFTSRYRVPFQFSRVVRENLAGGSMMASSKGVKVTDLDGNEFYDLAGSYGVNLLGVDFYRASIEHAVECASDLGPTLGWLHPIVMENVRRLQEVSGHEQVSFHMSGTEAVMQAVRLARYHTGKDKLVRFSGAYHGWWGDVQPGVGNPIAEKNTFTLADMSRRTLRVLKTRRDIACVLVNPLQGLHPNANAPGDSTLVDSGRQADFDRETYGAWLRELRDVCSRRGIVLILDEVFVGFRLAPGGAQEYFDVRADMVTYGKTLGGGLPVGVLCGPGHLMQRYRDDRPADICFARGTFNAHPYVMAAMHQFLEAQQTEEVLALYEGLDERWNARAQNLNHELELNKLPVRVVAFSTIWTIVYTQPSRYNWMFQYYLKDEGLALSWVGSGRLIFGLRYSDQDFVEVSRRFVAAAAAMRDDGWWWHAPELTNKTIKRQIMREMLAR